MEPLRMRALTRDEYPLSLQEIPEPPEELWALGSWPAPEAKRLVVVGSRALTSYGREACQRLIAGLAGYPVSIVSGLALGADACAHRAALDAGLHTIAIPGSGLGKDVLYPRGNVQLAGDILSSGGLLLSEHPPDYRARDHDFPSRNRITVGLADAVLMIEAGERSGTLITARLAGEYNRHLLCIPHRIGDAHGYGSHLFLRMGATLVSDASHLLEALGIEAQAIALSAPPPDLTDAERIVYAALETPHEQDALIRASSLPHAETMAALGMLELKGFARREYGMWRRSA